MNKLRAAIAVTVAAVLGLTACETQTGGPNNGQPAGYTCVSTQSWWQQMNGYGFTQVPQVLPSSGVGGHLHVEVCAPINKRVDGDTLALTVHVRTHQRFTGVGDRIDVGLAPGGSTLVAKTLNWDSRCPSGSCSTSAVVNVPLGSVGNGLQVLRIRYLPANHPNGERQFASNEIPFFHNTAPGACSKAVEGKSWYDTPRVLDYARAGFNGCLPEGPQSGTVVINQRFTSTNYNIARVFANMDASFGADDFSGLISEYFPAPGEGVGGSGRRNVAIDTTRYADGWHCLSVGTEVKDPGSEGVNTGVNEIPFLIDNGSGARTEHKGSCYVNGVPS